MNNRPSLVILLFFLSASCGEGLFSKGSDPGGGAGGTTCASDWFDCSFTKRIQLTINNSAQASNLIDFTVLVELTSSEIDYSDTQNAGQDIRFTDSDGVTALNHEIEKWNESGSSFVWVKIPQIDGASTTDSFWMYYNNPSASDGQNVTGTWDANYVLVQHLGSSLNGSTTNATVGSDLGSSIVAGKIGDARRFTGTGDGIDIPSTFNTSAGPFTAELWYNAQAVPAAGNHDIILGRGGAATTSWFFLSTGNSFLSIGTEVTGGGVSSGSTILSTVTWYYGAIRYNGSQARIHLDGPQDGIAGATPAGDTDAFRVGRDNATRFFDGTVDELRISNIERSVDYLSAQHKSMDGTFLTYGSPESI